MFCQFQTTIFFTNSLVLEWLLLSTRRYPSRISCEHPTQTFSYTSLVFICSCFMTFARRSIDSGTEQRNTKSIIDWRLLRIPRKVTDIRVGSLCWKCRRTKYRMDAKICGNNFHWKSYSLSFYFVACGTKLICNIFDKNLFLIEATFLRIMNFQILSDNSSNHNISYFKWIVSFNRWLSRYIFSSFRQYCWLSWKKQAWN